MQILTRTIFAPKLNLNLEQSDLRKNVYVGQWLWHSWQNDCFTHHTSAVRIQSLAIFGIEYILLLTVENIKLKNILLFSCTTWPKLVVNFTNIIWGKLINVCSDASICTLRILFKAQNILLYRLLHKKKLHIVVVSVEEQIQKYNLHLKQTFK